jgi:MFS family permease
VAKVKRHVLPLFVIMFIVNYLDRVNIGFVRPHLESDLGISAAAFGFGAGLFFIGYALFEVPSNMLLQKVGARLWLTRIMFTWGLVATAMAFVQNETQFYVLRFLLGVAEAGFFPGVIYYFTRWLPAAERGKAIAIFLSGSAVASLISGPLAGALMQIQGMGLHGWQWMLFIEGMASVALCFFVFFWLDSKPHDAKWLSREEQDALVAAIDQEQREREAGGVVKASSWSLLKDRQILLFCLIYFCIQLTIYAATFWLPSIIKRMGDLSDLQVGFFNSIPWLISIIAMYSLRCLRPALALPAGLGGGGAAGGGYRHVHVHHRRAGVRLRRRVLCGHRLQGGLVAVLADPPGLPGCTHRRGGDRPDQLGGQPRRLRRPHHLRPAGAADRLDPGRPVRPGGDLGSGRHCGVLRPYPRQGRACPRPQGRLGQLIAREIP